MAKYQSDYTGAQIEALLDKVNNSGTLLWTNSSPTTQFAAQTVSLDLSSYSSVKIHYYLKTSYTRTVISEHNKAIGMAFAITDENGGLILTRTINVSNSGVEFGGAAYSTGGSATASNAFLIPYQIYGIV